MSHKRIFFQSSGCLECSIEWVATHLEFALHKSDAVWAKPLLQCIVSEVPYAHATRSVISFGPKVPTSNQSTLRRQENVRLLLGGVRYRTVPLNSGAYQTTQDHSTSLVAPPTTLVEWFAKTIDVAHNVDNFVGRMFAINGAMAVLPDSSEATVIKFLQSKWLRPEGAKGGKMAEKRVFTGGRPKTAKEQGTNVSPPQAQDPDVDAHTEDGTKE